MYELWLKGSDGSAQWAATMQLSADQVVARKADIAMSAGAIRAGVGTAQLMGAQPVAAESGTIQVSLDHGRLAGQAVIAPDALAGTITGEVSVSCWVPQAALPGGSPGEGVGTQGSAAPLEEDSAFASSQCASFASLAH